MSGKVKRYPLKPRSVSFPSFDESLVHAYYYEPWNLDYLPSADEKSALIIRLHGRPTALASDSLSLTRQF